MSTTAAASFSITVSALTTTSSCTFVSSSCTFVSSSSTTYVSLGPLPQEKLARGNFLLWKVIMLPQIKGAQMAHHLDRKSPPPPATLAISKDGKEEQILNYA